MAYDPQKHHRRSIRLQGYDYTQAGAYFVTLVTWQRENLFGEIENGKMNLNPIGEIVQTTWMRLPAHFQIQLDESIIMPNHFHGVLFNLGRTGEASAFGEPFQNQPFSADASPQRRPNGTDSGSLGAIIQNFKAVSTRKINQYKKASGAPIWQRNYFERIIRNERELDAIREYIRNNPLKWDHDLER